MHCVSSTFSARGKEQHAAVVAHAEHALFPPREIFVAFVAWTWASVSCVCVCAIQASSFNGFTLLLYARIFYQAQPKIS